LTSTRDVEAVTDFLAEHANLDQAVIELTVTLGDLETDPTVLDALKHRQPVETGLPLVTDGVCPLCDLARPAAGALRQHLADKLARSEAAAKLQQRIQAAAGNAVGQLRCARTHSGSKTARRRRRCTHDSQQERRG